MDINTVAIFRNAVLNATRDLFRQRGRDSNAIELRNVLGEACVCIDGKPEVKLLLDNTMTADENLALNLLLLETLLGNQSN